jgi:hypothetical protein
MPLFEAGNGGKKKKRVWKPITSAGVAFSNSLELERNHVTQSSLAAPDGSQSTLLITNEPLHQSTFEKFQQEPFHTTPELNHENHNNNYLNHVNNSPKDHYNSRVQQLYQYFQSDNYKKKKMVEDKNWSKFYKEMFSSFMFCALKTSDWGDLEKWSTDWKEECQCTGQRKRPVVLLDILS